MKARLLIITLLLALLGAPIVALASDISNAQYYGTILVSNNSTATTNVATTANISTANLISGGYLNASANNTVIRNSSGADVPFMPSVNAPYPWAFWVPSIGANSYLNYILYTADSTGGEIRYFPGAGGMTVPDNASLELSDNFTIEQKGWIDTTAGADKNLVYKQGAFGVYVSGTENVTSYVFGAGSATTEDLVPNFDGDSIGIASVYGASTHWEAVDDSVGSPDDATTYVWTASETYQTDYYNLQSSGISIGSQINSVTVYRRVQTPNGGVYAYSKPVLRLGGVDTVGSQTLATGPNWVTYSETLSRPGGGSWSIADLENLQVGVQLHAYSAIYTARLTQAYVVVNYNPPLSVIATGVSSGEHTVRVTADTTDLKIFINGVEKDSAALSGASIPDNSNNWTFLQNDVMPYMEYTAITVNGAQAGYWDWEYDATFTDSSGNGNTATPTFRTASSDADVSAEMTGFLPIAEAKAPDYVLGEAPAFIDSSALTSNETGTFTTTPGTGAFPLAGVITAVADATGTPPQLPLLIIAAFVILAASLSISAVMRKHGSGSLIVKIIVITAFMGIFIALANFGIDFWMLFVFLVIAVALAFASRQLGWT